MMDKSEIELGKRVKTNESFSGVEKGTEGIIIEDYGTGITVAWDKPDRPIPEGAKFSEIARMPAIDPDCPLRDGFAKDELHYLEVVEGTKSEEKKKYLISIVKTLANMSESIDAEAQAEVFETELNNYLEARLQEILKHNEFELDEAAQKSAKEYGGGGSFKDGALWMLDRLKKPSK